MYEMSNTMLSLVEQVCKRLKLVFQAFCFILASNMSVLMVFRFYKNNDTSTVSYKLFNETPLDRYPTFSICLRRSDSIYRKEYLNQTKVFTPKNYGEILQGLNVTNKGRNRDDVQLDWDFNLIKNIDHQRATIKPRDVLERIIFRSRNDNETIRYSRYYKKKKNCNCDKSESKCKSKCETIDNAFTT